MRRREFIAWASAVVVFPLAARAQEPPKLPTIGFLGPNSASIDGPRVGAFVERLQAVDSQPSVPRGNPPRYSRDELWRRGLNMSDQTDRTATIAMAQLLN